MTRLLRLCFAFLSLGLIALQIGGCGGGTSGTGDTVAIRGQAIIPADGQPAADSEVIVEDFVTRSTAGVRAFTAGTTDADGNYIIEVTRRSAGIQITAQRPDQSATCGYTVPNRSAITKDLNAVTSIACVAIRSAIDDGALAPADVTNELIDRAEQAAAALIEAGDPDFSDPDTLPNLAAMVREDVLSSTPSPSPDPEPNAFQATACNCDDGFGPVSTTFVCADTGMVPTDCETIGGNDVECFLQCRDICSAELGQQCTFELVNTEPITEQLLGVLLTTRECFRGCAEAEA